MYYNKESLIVDHKGKRVWRVPGSFESKDLVCIFRKNIGTL